ncbi:MAG: hypothetical protein JRI23_26980, partial [Deltaproteobacteria bacterium]|nr:hypothetical protein [Deltaproteobacteria bacterium]MBW2535717.1 hypothetical protein [Deltaproteobacteria bacterium]
MSKWVWCAAATFVGVGALAIGCGGDDDTNGTGGSGATGGTTSTGVGGGGGGTSTETLTIIVWSEFGGTDPLEGAGVAVDLSDATRLEAVTDAQGEATIELPNGAQIEHLIAHKDGYSFFSYPASVLEEWTEARFWLMPDEDTSNMVAVSGNATNMNDSSTDILSVGASPGTGFDEEGVTAYDLLVESGEDFTLLAVDIGQPTVSGQDFTRVFHSVLFSSHSAITAAATVDLDFSASPLSNTAFTTQLALPADSVLATTGVAAINATSADHWAGGTTSCTKTTAA